MERSQELQYLIQDSFHQITDLFSHNPQSKSLNLHQLLTITPTAIVKSTSHAQFVGLLVGAAMGLSVGDCHGTGL